LNLETDSNQINRNNNKQNNFIMIHDDLTRKIIACAYKVHNTLGGGFLEKVYENSMMNCRKSSDRRN